MGYKMIDGKWTTWRESLIDSFDFRWILSFQSSGKNDMVYNGSMRIAQFWNTLTQWTKAPTVAYAMHIPQVMQVLTQIVYIMKSFSGLPWSRKHCWHRLPLLLEGEFLCQVRIYRRFAIKEMKKKDRWGICDVLTCILSNMKNSTKHKCV